MRTKFFEDDVRVRFVIERLLFLLGRLVFGYCFVAAIYIYCFKISDQFKVHDFYFLLGLGVMALIASFYSPATQGAAKFKKIEWLGILLVFSSILVWKTQFIDRHAMHRDELEEASLSRLTYPVFACSLQSQPPLGCVVTHFGETIFGPTEFGLRFHVVVFSVLASMFLFLLCLYLSRSWVVSIIAVAGLCLYPLVIEYSFQVRPIALGMFAAVQLLFALLSLNLNTQKNIPIKNWLWLIACSVFLLMTVGLQSAFFVAALFVAQLCLAVEFSPKHYIKTAAALAFSVLLYLPIQFWIFKISGTARVVINEKGHWNLHDLLNLIFERLFEYLIHLVGPIFWVPLATIVVVSGFLKWSKLDLSSNLKLAKLNEMLWALVIGFYFFYLSMPIFFNIFINSQIADRYILIGWVFSLVSMAVAYRIIQEVKGYNYFKIFLQLSLVSTLFYCTIWQYREVEKNVVFPNTVWDQRVLYRWAQGYLGPNDFLSVLCMPESNQHCFANAERPKGADVYFDESKYPFVHKDGLPQVELFKLFYQETNIEKLVMLLERVQGKSLAFEPEFLKLKSENFEIHDVQNEKAFVFKGGLPVIQKTWFNILEQVEKTEAVKNFAVIEYLMQKAILEKNRTAYEHYLKEWIGHSMAAERIELGLRRIYFDAAKAVFGE